MQSQKKAVYPSADVSDTADWKVWDRLRRGDLSKRRVWRAYRESLELTFPHVESLLEDIPGRTGITSDHGNLVGAFCTRPRNESTVIRLVSVGPTSLGAPAGDQDWESSNVQSDLPVESNVRTESDEVRNRLADPRYHSEWS